MTSRRISLPSLWLLATIALGACTEPPPDNALPDSTILGGDGGADLSADFAFDRGLDSDEDGTSVDALPADLGDVRVEEDAARSDADAAVLEDPDSREEPDAVVVSDADASDEPDAIVVSDADASDEPDAIFIPDVDANDEPDVVVIPDVDASDDPDTGLPDTGLPDTGLPDTGLPDTGLPDTGLADTGLADTGLADLLPEDDRVDGQACLSDEQCRGGACIEDWTDGYCTTVGCETFEDCATNGEDNRCLTGTFGDNFCVRICDDNEDCRDGYFCQPISGTGYCAPRPGRPVDIEPEDYPYLDISCGQAEDGFYTFDYTIPPGTTSYLVTPYVNTSESMFPSYVDFPSGPTADFSDDHSRWAAPASIWSYLNPTMFAPVSTMASQLVAGVHTYGLFADGEVCHYLVTEDSPGSLIDMNIYLVGLAGLNPRNAARNEDLQEMLDEVDEILGGAGAGVGTVNYYELSDELETAFRILRSEAEVGEILALSTPRGDTLAENLSLNLYIVESISFPGSSAIGISGGLPGPAGLHGQTTSGVVLTGEFLGQTFESFPGGPTVDGNALTAVTFTHELGHYLGLFHSTEQDGTPDPIADTPRCTSGFPNSCPDLTNLMFPIAGVDHTVITAGQAFVIAGNPLTR